MDHIWLIAALWLGLAIAATFLAHWLRLPTPVCEIAVGALAPVALAPLLGKDVLNPATPWVVFLAGAGSMLLVFLAGSELDPVVVRGTWKESLLVAFAGFALPFLGVAAVAHYLLGWSAQACWIAAVALSTASVSVAYTIMLELGLSHTGLGQGLLSSSYLNNLFSAVAMSVVIAPFTVRTLVLVATSAVIFMLLPLVSSKVFGRFRSRVSQPDVRFLLLLLFGMGGFSVWAGGEVVLPAYIMGMVLAGLVGRNHALIHHLRVVTFGILTPFYFLRAGTQMQIPAVAGAPLLFLTLLAAKLISKLIGVVPAMTVFEYTRRESAYCSLMLSTGLAVGSIAASLGLARGLLDQTQYSHLIAAVVGSAVIPTTLANKFALPKHLMMEPAQPASSKRRHRAQVGR